MTRVLVVTNMYPPHHLGGYELSCYDVVERLRRRGHHVGVLTSDMRVPGVEVSSDQDAGVWRELKLYLHDGELLSPSLRTRLAIERANQRALRGAIERVRPDVVSIWHMGALSMGLVTTLVRSGIPLLYSICDDWLTYGNRLDPWTKAISPLRSLGRFAANALGAPIGEKDLSTTGAFLFVSRLTRDRAVRYTGWTFPISDVVLSGIDSNLFRSVDPTDGFRWSWRLLFVGRYDVRKGLDTVLDAMALLPSESTLRVVGTGGGPERDRLVGRVAELGLDGRVTFEQRARHELPEVYADADALVFPSTWEEPFGLVPLEAMACRTPVVATGVGGGGAEFMRDGGNCLLFPAGDAGALADALHLLASDGALRARLVDGGERTARELDVDRLADTFEAWHRAAARHFDDGHPPRRILQLPRQTSVTLLPSEPPVREFALSPVPVRRPVLEISGDEQAVHTTSGRRRIVCDLAALPFTGGSFDAVRCVDALDRLADPAAALRDLGRVTRPGATAEFVAVNRHDLRRLARRQRDPHPSPRHLHSFTWRDFEHLIAPHFAVDGRVRTAGGESWKSRLLAQLLRLPLVDRLSPHVTLAARRR